MSQSDRNVLFCGATNLRVFLLRPQFKYYFPHGGSVCKKGICWVKKILLFKETHAIILQN